MNSNDISRTPLAGMLHGRWMLPCCLLLLVLGCVGAPVGVRYADPKSVHRTLTASVLSTGGVSGQTGIVLNRWGLAEQFRKAPQSALAKLREIALAEHGAPDELCALAELCFLHAEHGGRRPYYLAAVVYAYAFLFPEEDAGAPATLDPYDPRLRLACDLYNRGLTLAFKANGGRGVDLRGGVFDLPFGKLEVAFNPADLRWAGRELYQFTPVAELKVYGFTNRYRWPGIGAPLAAAVRPLSRESKKTDFIDAKVKVPVTALIRIENPRRQLASNDLRAQLEIHNNSGGEVVRIGERRVPLEAEPTASLAFMLSSTRFWKEELRAFLHGDFRGQKSTRLAFLKPWRRGRIPVVFVHGTYSSPGRWANMLNELDNDPWIHEHFQFWFFIYESGNPISYSAMLLRESLQQAVAQLDPDGRDPALRRMVVIGHSQGGLLTKLTAIDSGSRFWDSISRKPLERTKFSPATKDLMRRALFVHPLPFVQRVIYIATPHRGSYLALKRPSLWISGLIRFPKDLLSASDDLLHGNTAEFRMNFPARLPTSLDNMRPGNKYLKTLESIPLAPGVTAHSIVAVKGNGPPEKGGDGVVKYTSAHLAGAASEIVVRSDHSCQSNPQVINEVRRILLLDASQTEGRPVNPRSDQGAKAR